jgi:hypothetical protein
LFASLDTAAVRRTRITLPRHEPLCAPDNRRASSIEMPCREHVPPDVTACVFGRSSSASASLARQLMGRGHGRHPGRHAVLGHHDRGSGLRSGDANISTVSPYAQFNVGIAREFLLPDDSKPMTLRFDIINLFETVYQIRSGSGIVCSPQCGPRRGFLGI